MFLITGCGRSGTLYMAKALRAAGLDVGHEEAGEDGAVSSAWCVDSRHYPYYHEQGPRPEFDIVLHQVRHPLPTIASLTTSQSASWAFTEQFVPIPEGDVVAKAAYFWYHWNTLAERQAEFTYRIENLENRWDEIMSVLRHNAPYSSCAQLLKNVNSRVHGAVNWTDIPLARQIRGMARRYGYTIGDINESTND